ncbi:MAG: polysaccharide deacetylase family protein [Neomegalonema sp.]|nr:polysaccharide deacetylase family protein [Neomegalonema sp.]
MKRRVEFILNQFVHRSAAALCASVLFWNGAAAHDLAAIEAMEDLAAGVVDPHDAAHLTSGAPARRAPKLAPGAIADPCKSNPEALGVSRVITLDPRLGKHFGNRAHYLSTKNFLRPKEVVLTFDDGPTPRTTRRILATLREFCVKATFFAVGKLARRYPGVLREVLADGHTIAGHTYAHPMPFASIGMARAQREIESGFRALGKATGEAPAAIFRFPGLSETAGMRDYLAARNIMSLGIDVDSGDWRRGATTEKVVKTTVRDIRRLRGGVVLFHDPLKRTARALPAILRSLKKHGYKVVHVVSAAPYVAPDGSARFVAAEAPYAGPYAGPWRKPRKREISSPLIGGFY